MPFTLTLLRAILKLTASDIPLDQVWARCAEAFERIGGADGLTFARRNAGLDSIEHFDGAASLEPVVEGSILARALRSGKTIVEEGELARIGLPFRYGDSVLGAFAFVHRGTLTDDDMETLEACASALATRVDREAVVRDGERLARFAFTDALTGIANRRVFDDALAREWALAKRREGSVALLMLDVDYFKLFNDTYGHQAGDRCLQGLAGAFAEAIARSGDLAARYGGEEFVALLPDTTAAGAIVLAEGVREAIEAIAIEHAASSLGRVSVSIGIAALVPEGGSTADVLLRASDSALYRAKLGGRNRAVALGYESAAEPATPMRTHLRDHLPFRISGLVGRASELEALVDSIDAHRLTTVIGGGGSGKTRLVIEAAWRIADRFEGGAQFVDLTPLRDPLTVVPAIASVLDIANARDDVDGRMLSHALDDRRVLIVLDNCEHLIETVAPIAEALLRACPNVRIVATSREPLGARGEVLYRMPPLALPPAGDLGASEAGSYGAVALFVERAAAVSHNFVLDDKRASLVTSICRSFAGIALAISLAAARVGTMPLEEIARRVREHSTHEAMHSALAWSYGLLDESERRLFRRIAVFVGTFSSEAVQAVCGDDLSTSATFERIVQLVRKSMLVSTADGRYHLLEPVRAFATSLFVASSESETIARRHATFFAHFARRQREAARTLSRSAWVRRIAPDIDNLRAAIGWALGAQNDVEEGAGIVGDIGTTWEQFGVVEGLRNVDEALSRTQTVPHVWLAKSWMLDYFGALPRRQLEAAERALALFERNNDAPGLFDAYLRRAQCFSNLRRHAEARSDLERAARLADQLGPSNYGILVMRASARATLKRGDWSEAGRLYGELVAHYRQEQNAYLTAVSLKNLAESEFARGDAERAIAIVNEPETLAMEAVQRVILDTNQTAYLVVAGRFSEAYVIGRSVIRTSWELEMRLGRILTIQHLALAAAIEGDISRAARLRGYVDAVVGELEFERDYTERFTYERLVGLLESRLSSEVRNELERVGAAQTDEEAAADAIVV